MCVYLCFENAQNAMQMQSIVIMIINSLFCTVQQLVCAVLGAELVFYFKEVGQMIPSPVLTV